jgi:TolB protein
MNVDGSNQVNISNNGESDSGPSWSTDGTKIAFSSMRDDATWGEIYTMNADGTDVIRLTDNNTYDGTPSWSP